MNACMRALIVNFFLFLRSCMSRTELLAVCVYELTLLIHTQTWGDVCNYLTLIFSNCHFNTKTLPNKKNQNCCAHSNVYLYTICSQCNLNEKSKIQSVWLERCVVLPLMMIGNDDAIIIGNAKNVYTFLHKSIYWINVCIDLICLPIFFHSICFCTHYVWLSEINSNDNVKNWRKKTQHVSLFFISKTYD